MKKEVKKRRYEYVMRVYGKYIHFKIDTDKIYVVSDVSESEIYGRMSDTLYVLSDRNVAENLASIIESDDLENDLENGEYILLEEIQITDFVPIEPVKKFYLYAVPETDYCSLTDEFLGLECEYGGLQDEVSEGYTWYDSHETEYILPDTLTNELWDVVHNIGNPRVWTDEMWKSLYSLKKTERYHYRCDKGERFYLMGTDETDDSIIECDYLKRVVRVKDGKPYVACK